MGMALELASVDLFRIRRSQAETISRWLTDDKALASFERAIVLRLEVHYGLWSPRPRFSDLPVWARDAADF